MIGFDGSRARLVDQFPCASDVAKGPSRESQTSGCRDGRVLTETEHGFAVSLGIANSQRLFEMRPRLSEIALEEKSQS